LADRPTPVTFGLTLAVVLFIVPAIGMLLDQQIEQQQSHEAFAAANKHAVCHTCASVEWAPIHWTDVIN